MKSKEKSSKVTKPQLKKTAPKTVAIKLSEKQKKIFITGGTRGIGLAIAEKFYAAGWLTGICARNLADLEKLARKMPGLKTYVADLSDKLDCKALAERINRDFGALDVLVNNAGIFLPGLLTEEKSTVFESLLATNVNSAFYFTRGILPEMKKAGKGLIVNMCSIASLRAYPSGGSYTVSKHALLGLSRVMREELKPHGIRVTALLPGAVWTSSWEGSGFTEDKMIPAEDIAELTWALAQLSPRTDVEDIVVRPMMGDL